MKKSKKKRIRRVFSQALDAVVKPIEKVVIKPIETVSRAVVGKPVSFLADQFNLVVKNLEEIGTNKEKVSEVDGFVHGLMDELKNVEKSFFAFFGEMLFIHNLAEGMATLENELELVSILGDQIKKSIKTDLLIAYLWNEKQQQMVPCYQVIPNRFQLPEDFKVFVLEEFRKGEARLHENKLLDSRVFNILSIPLRTTSEKFGILFVGRKRSRTFQPEESTLIFAGATLVSFALSNFKLNQKILRDKQMVVLGQTIGSISHDIKNILTGFEGSMDLINSGLRDKNLETVTEGVNLLNSSYQRMKEMVLAMVDYSKNRLPELAPKDINNIIQEVVARNEPLYTKRKVKVLLNLDKHLPHVYVDDERIDRMISNLFSNALDAVYPETGIITLGTEYFPDKEVVHIWVEDNGRGIPPQALDKIFDLFYSTKGTRGSGFGLAIVQKVVNEHNGTIEVSSRVNSGTKFLIKLPAKPSSPQDV